MNQPQRIRGGAHSWIRGNVLGLVAIFIALSGSAVATQVASKQTAKKTAATSAVKKKRGPRGPAGPPGAPGPPGAAGLSTGQAGGDLTGNYPSPQIAPEAVGPSETGSVPAAKAFIVSDISVPDSTATTIHLGGEFFDSADMHDDVTNNQNVTVPIDGVYLVEAMLVWALPDTPTVTIRQITIGGAIGAGDARASLTTADTVNNASAIVQLFQGDDVQLIARQTSGAALNAISAQLSMVWLGPPAPA